MGSNPFSLNIHELGQVRKHCPQMFEGLSADNLPSSPSSELLWGVEPLTDPLDQLPPELVSEIFLLCQAKDPSSKKPSWMEITVSHVCQHWRRRALSTPRLWSTINARCTVTTPNRIEAYLARSKSALLDITIWIRGSHYDKNGPELVPLILPKIIQQCRRWQRLDLRVSVRMNFWAIYGGLFANISVPQLAVLEIDMCHSPDPAPLPDPPADAFTPNMFEVDSAQKLRRVTFRVHGQDSVWTHSPRYPMPPLASIEGLSLSLDHAPSALIPFAALEEATGSLRHLRLQAVGALQPQALHHPVKLQNLTSLWLDNFRPSLTDFPVSGGVVFPALTYLVLQGGSYFKDSQLQVSALRASFPALKHLAYTLCAINKDSQIEADYLSNMAWHISTLTLIETVRLPEDPSIEGLIASPNWTNLKTVRFSFIGGVTVESQRVLEMVKAAMKGAKSLREKRGGTPGLELEMRRRMVWELRERFPVTMEQAEESFPLTEVESIAIGWPLPQISVISPLDFGPTGD